MSGDALLVMAVVCAALAAVFWILGPKRLMTGSWLIDALAVVALVIAFVFCVAGILALIAEMISYGRRRNGTS